jgi:hypothetical protein
VTTPTRLAVVALALSLSTSAQKSWADGAEYDLHRSIASTPDPVRQIALIYEWQARYPQTGFEQERLQLLAYANKRAGKPEEAFATALQLLRIDSHSADSLMLVAKLGPTLPNPTQQEIGIITDAANKLLMPIPVSETIGLVLNPDEAPKRRRVVAAADPLPPPTPLAHTNLSPEEEAQRVDFFIKDIRRTDRLIRLSPPLPNPAAAQRAAAEAALAWVKSLKR